MELSELSKNLSTAVRSSKSKLEDIKNTSFNQISPTFNNVTFATAGLTGMGVSYVNNVNANLLNVTISFSWQQSNGRIVGEDKNLNGVLNAGEDLNGNGVRDIYVEDSDLSGTDDQIVLMLGEQIFDAVVWTNKDGSMTKDEVADTKRLIDAGQWRGTVNFSDQSAGVDIGFSRVPIRRTSPTMDSNSKDDWSLSTK
jgi:hypothetical protein